MSVISYCYHTVDKSDVVHSLQLDRMCIYRSLLQCQVVHFSITFHKRVTNLDVNTYSSKCLTTELMAPLFTLSFHCFSLTGKDETIKTATCNDKKITTVRNGQVTKPNEDPLTGTEVVQIFARKRDLGELELYYLKEVAGDFNRYSKIRLCTSWGAHN